MARILLLPVLGAALLLSGGCAATPLSRLEYRPGAVLETLSADASLSMTRGDQGMAGSGYLLYRRPDRLRLVVLSPLGTPLMDLYVNGDRVTIIDSSHGTAFSGPLAELPRSGLGAEWRHVRWIMEIDRPDPALSDGEKERTGPDGAKERVTIDHGIVVTKSRPNGDMVRYLDFSVVNGVPLAAEVILDAGDGGRFRIRISEPEVNSGLPADAFTPRLEGMTVYPLSALRGQ